MTKIIGFCAGPSAGKTTNAMALSAWMKDRRLNVHYVPEVAMEKVVDEHHLSLDDQLSLLGEQHHRLYRALGLFDYVVTDSPIFMMLHYMKTAFKRFNRAPAENLNDLISDFQKLILSTFKMYDNEVFFVERGTRKFLQAGRLQNEEESKRIDHEILNLMDRNSIPYNKVKDLTQVLSILYSKNILIPDWLAQ